MYVNKYVIGRKAYSAVVVLKDLILSSLLLLYLPGEGIHILNKIPIGHDFSVLPTKKRLAFTVECIYISRESKTKTKFEPSLEQILAGASFVTNYIWECLIK